MKPEKTAPSAILQGRHANVPEPGFFIPQLQFTSLRMKGEKVNALSVLSQWHFVACKQSPAFNGGYGKQKILYITFTNLTSFLWRWGNNTAASNFLLCSTCRLWKIRQFFCSLQIFSKVHHDCKKFMHTLLQKALWYLTYVSHNLNPNHAIGWNHVTTPWCPHVPFQQEVKLQTEGWKCAVSGNPFVYLFNGIINPVRQLHMSPGSKLEIQKCASCKTYEKVMKVNPITGSASTAWLSAPLPRQM